MDDRARVPGSAPRQYSSLKSLRRQQTPSPGLGGGLLRAPRGASRRPPAGCIAPQLRVSFFLPKVAVVLLHSIFILTETTRMPSAPDWRSASAYAYVDELNAAEFAAEFLRRNPAYRQDYLAALEHVPDGPAVAPLTSWGLRFPFRPRRTRGPNLSGLAAPSCLRGRSSRARARGICRRAQHRHAPANIPGCRKRRPLPDPSKSHASRPHRRCHDGYTRSGYHSAR